MDAPEENGNPVAFWSRERKMYPRLWGVARQILCAPGSTGGIERIFSIAGFLMSPRRIVTTDPHFEKFLFAKANFELVDKAMRMYRGAPKRKRSEKSGDESE